MRHNCFYIMMRPETPIVVPAICPLEWRWETGMRGRRHTWFRPGSSVCEKKFRFRLINSGWCRSAPWITNVLHKYSYVVHGYWLPKSRCCELQRAHSLSQVQDMQINQVCSSWSWHVKLGGKRGCIELNAVIECTSSRRSGGIRRKKVIYLSSYLSRTMRKLAEMDIPLIQYHSILSATNDWDLESSWQYDKTRRDPWSAQFRIPRCSTSSWYCPDPRHMLV